MSISDAAEPPRSSFPVPCAQRFEAFEFAKTFATSFYNHYPPKPFTSPFPGLFIIYLARSKGLFIRLVCC